MQAVAILKGTTGNRQMNGTRTAQRSVVLSWLTRIFGCWHREMSRPFTLRAESYRACLECGAHRRFNSQTWEMTGPYYYESAQPLYHNATAAVKTAPRAIGRTQLRAAA